MESVLFPLCFHKALNTGVKLLILNAIRFILLLECINYNSGIHFAADVAEE